MDKPGTPLPSGGERDLAIVAGSALVWGLGEGLFIYFIPLALQRWNADAVQIGAVLSLVGASMALVQAPAGWLSDRLGARPIIFASLILGMGAAGLMAAASSLPLFVAGLLAYGCTSFISAPMYSYVTRLRGSWTVQRAVTFRAAAFQVGAIAGPLLGGRLAGTAGLDSVFGYAAGLFAAATLLMALARNPPAAAPEAAARLASPVANPRFLGLLAVVVVTLMAMRAPQQLTTLYLQEVEHVSIQHLGAMGTAANLGTAGLMLALGNLRAPTGMLVGQLLMGGFALLMWRGQSLSAYYAGHLLVGGAQLYRAMALAWARALVKAGDTGLAYGLVETGQALAVVAGPLAAGWLYSYQPEAMYAASLGALALTVALNWLLWRRQRGGLLPAQMG